MSVSSTAEILDRDAVDQARLVRERVISARELRAAYVKRLENVNPRLNAVVADLDYDEQPHSASDAPLHGVPMLVKDLISSVAGVRQTEGSAVLAKHVAASDSTLVARYRKTGLVIVGKTNTSEFGHKPVTEGNLFGPAANPWDETRNAGGSSGGSAAAVASRLVAIAHGNDAGGSIRIPASCCGVFGFKPSFGAMPMEVKAGPFSRRFISEHVITRTVRDSARVFLETASCRPAWPTDLLETDPSELRIAFSPVAPVDLAVDRYQIEGAEVAARQCEELGHAVAQVPWPINGNAVFGAWFGLWADAIGWQVREAARVAGTKPDVELYDSSTWRLYERSLSRTPLDAFDDLRLLELAAAQLERALGDYDIWLSPTLAQPPPPLEPDMDASPRAYLEFSPFTRLANIAGQPSFSAPLRQNSRGLPVGALFTARRGRDAMLFQLAAQLEQTPIWRTEPPPPSPAATPMSQERKASENR